MARIPEDRLMIETYCPWCDIRPSHAGHKLVKELENIEELAELIYENTSTFFL